MLWLTRIRKSSQSLSDLNLSNEVKRAGCNPGLSSGKPGSWNPFTWSLSGGSSPQHRYACTCFILPRSNQYHAGHCITTFRSNLVHPSPYLTYSIAEQFQPFGNGTNGLLGSGSSSVTGLGCEDPYQDTFEYEHPILQYIRDESCFQSWLCLSIV
ncbi:hypothetical protein LIA77_10862 [Sarocladium implicatum]|nr:hypothetical protein LIA77_10862 [Sarocladium implicatum]